jgi:hypothetical protein
MIFKEIIAIYSQNYTESISTVCGKSTEFLIVNVASTML